MEEGDEELVERPSIDHDLPLHWYRYFDDDGLEYFYNEETDETTWEHPGHIIASEEQTATNVTHSSAAVPISNGNPFGNDEDDEDKPETLVVKYVEEAQESSDSHENVTSPEDMVITDELVASPPPSSCETDIPDAVATDPLTADVDESLIITLTNDVSPSESIEVSQKVTHTADDSAQSLEAEDESIYPPLPIETVPALTPTAPPLTASSNPFGDDDEEDDRSIPHSSLPVALETMPVALPLRQPSATATTSNPFGEEDDDDNNQDDTPAVICVVSPADMRNYLSDAVPTVASPSCTTTTDADALRLSIREMNTRVPAEQRRVAPVVAVPASDDLDTRANRASSVSSSSSSSSSAGSSSIGMRETRLEKAHHTSHTTHTTHTTPHSTNPFASSTANHIASASRPVSHNPFAGAAATAPAPAPTPTPLPPRRPPSQSLSHSQSQSHTHAQAVSNTSKAAAVVSSNPFEEDNATTTTTQQQPPLPLPPQRSNHSASSSRPVSQLHTTTPTTTSQPSHSPLVSAFSGTTRQSTTASAETARYHHTNRPLPPPPPPAGHLPPPPRTATNTNTNVASSNTTTTTSVRRSLAVAQLGQATGTASQDYVQHQQHQQQQQQQNITNNTRPLSTSGAPVPLPPPPLPARRRPPPLTNSQPLPAPPPPPLAAANRGVSMRVRGDDFAYPEPLQQLLRWGVKPGLAESVLLETEGDLERALSLVHDTLRTLLARSEVVAGGSVTQQWYPRFTVSVRSWLPNFMEDGDKDYHTVYVIHVAYNTDPSGASSSVGSGGSGGSAGSRLLVAWQLLFRYQRFRQLYNAIAPHVARVLANMSSSSIGHVGRLYAIPEFPHAGVSDWMFGVSDELRDQRMLALHAWCEAVVSHPLLMTHSDIRRLVWAFFDVEAHI